MAIMDTLVERAINKAGGLSELARRMKTSPQAINNWRERGVPAERVLEFEQVTGISRHQLRPDVFGKTPSNPPLARAANGC